jgi:hypothetical protein
MTRAGEYRRFVHFDFVYSSACPCSAELAEHARDTRGVYGVPHSQRSKARIVLEEAKGKQDLDRGRARPLPEGAQDRDAGDGEARGRAGLRRAERRPPQVRRGRRPAPLPRVRRGQADRDFQIACSHLESLHSHDAVSVICKGVKGGFKADFMDFFFAGLLGTLYGPWPPGQGPRRRCSPAPRRASGPRSRRIRQGIAGCEACAGGEELGQPRPGGQGLRRARGRVRVFPCDVSDEAEVEELAAAVRRRFGAVDVLVNNAGKYVGRALPLHVGRRLRPDDRRKPAGLFLVSRPSRRDGEAGRGDIFNMGSVAGITAFPGAGLHGRQVRRGRPLEGDARGVPGQGDPGMLRPSRGHRLAFVEGERRPAGG